MLPDDARIVGVIADNIERGKLDHPGFYRNTQLAEALRRVLDAALSAQPSPGGQGDELDLDRVLSLADVHAEESREDGVRLLDRGGLLAFAQDVVSALSARQPVGEPVVISKEARECLQEIIDNCWRDEDQAVASEIDRLMRGPLYTAPTTQAVNLGPASIPDTPEVRDILGRPNFWCSPWANVLRMRGDAIPRKAEEEQAAVIRFMLNHYLANGADWAETAGAELDAIRKADSQAVGK